VTLNWFVVCFIRTVAIGFFYISWFNYRNFQFDISEYPFYVYLILSLGFYLILKNLVLWARILCIQAIIFKEIFHDPVFRLVISQIHISLTQMPLNWFVGGNGAGRPAGFKPVGPV
jgi:hypothetical protein